MVPSHHSFQLGGAAGFAVAAHALGCDVVASLLISTDRLADLARQLIGEAGIELIEGSPQPDVETPISIVIESGKGWRTALVIAGSNENVSFDSLNAATSGRAGLADIVHHGYPCLTPRLSWIDVDRVASIAPRALHLMDLNGAEEYRPTLSEMNLFGAETVIKGNASEWRACSRVGTVQTGCVAALRAGARCAVVTEGRLGASAVLRTANELSRARGADRDIEADATHEYFKSETANIEGDATGAGDAFFAAFAVRLVASNSLSGSSVQRALDEGNAFAGSWIARGEAQPSAGA